MKKKVIILLTAILMLSFGCASVNNPADYSYISNWAYLEKGSTDAAADVFFVCPTVYSGGDNNYNMQLDDEAAKADFIGAINMEKGIYDEGNRFFAPFYRQASLNVYKMSEDEREKYLDAAFGDVLAAFDYYYNNLNEGNPIILAGFSQGADMCLRLMKARFNNPDMQSRLIACYAIGWSISEEELSQYSYLSFAEDSDDTGVIISFNAEAPHIESSLIVSEGEKTLAINPLNWQTNDTVADKSLNMGACFTDYNGEIIEETPNFTGAYIDEQRGTLKVTDVNEEDYSPQLDIFESGIYHVYDYQFFYRNLQENVRLRTGSYIDRQITEAA